MQLTSSVFEHGGHIPSKYTCDGDDINPPLEIHSVPAGTKSFALIVDDPDAPAGTWAHWVVHNIDASTKTIPEHSVPVGGRQDITSFGKIGYGGPCPHQGLHHYHFKLYALDTTLAFEGEVTKSDVEEAMAGHIIESAELVGLYERVKK